MILLLNTIVDKDERSKFSEKVFPRFLGSDYVEIDLWEAFVWEDGFSGLVITGSELSASSGSEMDGKFFDILDRFVKRGLPVLGICWGHQMMARYFGGDECVVRAKTPEFGWRRVELLRRDELFEGIENPIFGQSHFDEVAVLRDGWLHLASTEECRLQAIRFGDKPFWGVQFHPEAFFALGTAMFAKNLREQPEIEPYHRNDLTAREILDQNSRIFENFTKLCRKGI